MVRDLKLLMTDNLRDIARMESQLDSVQMVLDDLDVKVERMDEAIRGNGSLGLTAQVAVLDRRIESCEEFVLEFKTVRRWLTLGVLGLFGSLAWSALEWFIATQH